jgi:molybdate transport system ATP-binding protein
MSATRSASFALSGQLGDFQLDARAAWDAQRTALFGASGSGKSTVLEALAGLRPRIHGEIVLRGRRVDGLPPRERRVGWVPQDAALFPHLTVRGQLEFARRAGASRATSAAGAAAAGTPSDADAMSAAIDVLELAPLLDRRANRLSGGERQRVAVARALASSPDILLLDEPLAAVDRPLRARIVPFLARLPAATGVPLLFVTHDPHEVLALADHVLVLQAGRVVAAGPPRDVLAAPGTLGALESLSTENLFDVTAEGPPQGGALTLRTAHGCRLVMAATPGFALPTRVAVPAEDIILSVDKPGRVSAQNVFPGRVTALEPAGDQVLVRVEASEQFWVARVTSRAATTLQLAVGGEVHLLIKAHVVRAVETPRETSS